MKSLEDIYFFVQVIKYGGFSRAGNALGLPKSTVSRRVQQLEESMGLQLILRTTRKIQLTKAGEKLYQSSKSLLDQFESIQTEILEEKNTAAGLIRFTAPIELGTTLLPPWISEFEKKYPKIEFDLYLTDRAVNLRDEGFDVALRAGELPDSSLKSRKAGTDMFSLFASPGYLKLHGTPEKPQDLAKHKCIVFAHDNREVVWKLTNGSSRQSIPVANTLRVNSLSMAVELSKQGLGIVLIPKFLSLEPVQHNQLQGVLNQWNSGKIPFYLIHPGHKHVPLRVQIFLDFMIEKLRSYPCMNH